MFRFIAQVTLLRVWSMKEMKIKTLVEQRPALRSISRNTRVKDSKSTDIGPVWEEKKDRPRSAFSPSPLNTGHLFKP